MGLVERGFNQIDPQRATGPGGNPELEFQQAAVGAIERMQPAHLNGQAARSTAGIAHQEIAGEVASAEADQFQLARIPGQFQGDRIKGNMVEAGFDGREHHRHADQPTRRGLEIGRDVDQRVVAKEVEQIDAGRDVGDFGAVEAGVEGGVAQVLEFPGQQHGVADVDAAIMVDIADQARIGQREGAKAGVEADVDALRALHVEGGVASVAAAVAEVDVDMDAVVDPDVQRIAGGVAEADFVQVKQLFGAIAIDVAVRHRAEEADQFRAGIAQRAGAREVEHDQAGLAGPVGAAADAAAVADAADAQQVGVVGELEVDVAGALGVGERDRQAAGNNGADALAGAGAEVADAEEGFAAKAGDAEVAEVVVAAGAIAITIEQVAGQVLEAVTTAGQAEMVVTRRERAAGLDEAGAAPVGVEDQAALDRAVGAAEAQVGTAHRVVGGGVEVEHASVDGAVEAEVEAAAGRLEGGDLEGVRLDREADRGEVAGNHPVVGPVGEAVRTGIAGIRAVAEAAVGIKRQAAVRRAGDQDGGERVVIDVAVVGQDAEVGSDQQRSARQQGVAVIRAERGVVDRVDYQGDRGVGAKEAIADPVGEAVAAEPIAGRPVVEDAVGVQHHAAVGDCSEESDTKGVTVDIVVVTKHVADEDAVFVADEPVIHRHGGVVQRGEVQCGAAGDAEIPVGHGIAEAHRGGVVLSRGVGPGAVQVVDQAAVAAGDCQAGCGQAGTVDISRVA